MQLTQQNHLGQTVGFSVGDWKAPPLPSKFTLQGKYVTVVPLEVTHAADLFDANSSEANWTYLPYGPFASLDDYSAWISKCVASTDPLFFAVISNKSQKPVGIASLLRIDPTNGSIELGHLNFSPLLQRTPMSTETVWLIMTECYGLGYRRFEWKCDALNLPSRSAAQRFGLSYEGIFRCATSYKGRNRDTAWYASTYLEWPRINEAFKDWLAPENFDAEGIQKVALSTLTKPLLVSKDEAKL